MRDEEPMSRGGMRWDEESKNRGGMRGYEGYGRVED